MEAIINNKLYINETTPYIIDSDLSDITAIYVPENSLAGYKELNPEIKDLIRPFNFLTVKEGRNQELYDALTVIITNESNAPVMSVMYAKGLAENENYMTLKEAKAVQNDDLTEAFKDNTDIVSFDELKYFTGLTEIPQAMFQEASNLKHIILPHGIKKINSNAFYCTSGESQLETVGSVENVVEIGDYVFARCTNLQELNFTSKLKKVGAMFLGNIPQDQPTWSRMKLKSFGNLSGIESMGIRAFGNFDSPYITELYAPNCTELINESSTGGRQFYNTGLKKITLNDNCNLTVYCFGYNGDVHTDTDTSFNHLEEITNSFNVDEYLPQEYSDKLAESYNVFMYSTTIKKINSDFNSLKSIPYYMFANCFSLEKIGKFPNVEIINGYAFRNCYSLPYVKFPKVNYVAAEAFINAKSTIGEQVYDGNEPMDRVVEFGLPYEQINFNKTSFKGCKRVTIICDGVELTAAQYTAIGATKPQQV